MKISKIRKNLKITLDKHRYNHSIGVSHTAISLAMCHGYDIFQAELAGLLHDCAKCISDSDKIKICKENKIKISKSEKHNPYLLHGKVGSYIATTEYGIQDIQICNAIMYHTTGREDMALLEKIIFVADYIEPNRKLTPKLTEIRKEAFVNLDIALTHILEETLEYLNTNKNKEIHPATQMTYDFYKKGLGR